jgi:hypothetical protein
LSSPSQATEKPYKLRGSHTNFFYFAFAGYGKFVFSFAGYASNFSTLRYEKFIFGSGDASTKNVKLLSENS